MEQWKEKLNSSNTQIILLESYIAFQGFNLQNRKKYSLKIGQDIVYRIKYSYIIYIYIYKVDEWINEQGRIKYKDKDGHGIFNSSLVE